MKGLNKKAFKKNTVTKNLVAKIVTVGCLSVSGLTIPTTVNANDLTGPYISGHYGGFKSRGGDFEDENDIYEISAGYRFLPFFGIEFGYTDFGKFGGDVASAELDGYSASAIGLLPITDHITFYGEVGQFYSDVEVNFLDLNEDYNNDTLFYGIGMDFKVKDPLWISVEYQRYKVDVDDSNWPVELDDEDTDIDTLKVGAKFYF